MEETTLLDVDKEALVKIITGLQSEIEKKKQNFMKMINLRFYYIERSLYMHQQYKGIEVSAIPHNIPIGQLEVMWHPSQHSYWTARGDVPSLTTFLLNSSR